MPPRPKALYVDGSIDIRCVVSNLKNDQGLTIAWSQGERRHHNDLKEMTLESNGTYTIVSHLPISFQDWESGKTFTCSVEHPSFASPILKEISKTAGKEEITLFSFMGTNGLIVICAEML